MADKPTIDERLLTLEIKVELLERQLTNVTEAIDRLAKIVGESKENCGVRPL